MASKRRILVTGGAGFIGSHLCDALVGEGHSVTVLDNLSLGKRENIVHLNDRIRFVEGDASDRQIVEDLFRSGPSFETVFHFAANSDIAAGVADPGVDYRNTFLSTRTVLEAMRRFGGAQMIFPSSSAVYGFAAGPIAEHTASLAPVSHYGAAKLASEAFLSAYAHLYGIQGFIVRFPNVVGDRATHGVVHDIINKLKKDPDALTILGDGAQAKPYLYVKELVDALLFVWEHAHDLLNVYNIGPETVTTVRTIAAIVTEEMGLAPEITFTGGKEGWPGDVPRYEYDLAKIHSLGWKASRSSDEAVRLSVRRILKKS